MKELLKGVDLKLYTGEYDVVVKLKSYVSSIPSLRYDIVEDKLTVSKDGDLELKTKLNYGLVLISGVKNLSRYSGTVNISSSRIPVVFSKINTEKDYIFSYVRINYKTNIVIYNKHNKHYSTSIGTMLPKWYHIDYVEPNTEDTNGIITVDSMEEGSHIILP